MWTDPLLLLWVLLLACGAMRWRKWNKAAFITGSLAIFWLLLFSTPFVPRFLINSLESQYRPFDTAQYAYLQDDSVYIVVLASGYTADAQFPPSIQLTGTSLVRLVEGIRIQRFFPKGILVTTATGNAGAPYSLAQVEAMAANSLGVPFAACLPIPGPANTQEEAVACRKRCGTKHSIILVTTANHMPRALMHFKYAGLNPIPAPTDYQTKRDAYHDKVSILPDAHNPALMRFALHEYVGYIWGKIWWNIAKQSNL